MARDSAHAPTRPPQPARRRSRRRSDLQQLHRERNEHEEDGRKGSQEPAANTWNQVKTAHRSAARARAQVQAGLELRNWGVYAPFLSTMVTFESMVTAARRTALPHQLWEVQRDCLQSARLAYSNPPGSCSPPRQADDLCADHLRPQVVGAVRRPALASSRWMGRGRGTAHLSPP